MEMCGYHLRCSNYWQRCSECSQEHKDKNRDYLHDVLCSWSEDNEAFEADEPAFSQKADTAPFEAVFLRLLSTAGFEPAGHKLE
jgi:hypothetical protein